MMLQLPFLAMALSFSSWLFLILTTRLGFSVSWPVLGPPGYPAHRKLNSAPGAKTVLNAPDAFSGDGPQLQLLVPPHLDDEDGLLCFLAGARASWVTCASQADLSARSKGRW